jgi:hypothetical protein
VVGLGKLLEKLLGPDHKKVAFGAVVAAERVTKLVEKQVIDPPVAVVVTEGSPVPCRTTALAVPLHPAAVVTVTV